MTVYHEQPWQEPLCQCWNDKRICCLGLWCCCCLYSQTATKIDHQSTCLRHCCMYTWLSLLGCCCLIHALKREQLREQYSIQESICGDCFTTCCCAPCAICQEAREIQARGYPPPPIIIIHQPNSSTSSAGDVDENSC